MGPRGVARDAAHVEPVIAVAGGKELETAAPVLARMLREAVALGAGLGYAEPPTQADAEGAWRGWIAEAEAGRRVILLARVGDAIAGTVQLDLARVANAAHRAELAKLIVFERYRGHKIGTKLIHACLEEARRRGRTTVWLNTVEQDAERLYARLGFTRVGEIPRWSTVGGEWKTSSFWWIHL